MSRNRQQAHAVLGALEEDAGIVRCEETYHHDVLRIMRCETAASITFSSLGWQYVHTLTSISKTLHTPEPLPPLATILSHLKPPSCGQGFSDRQQTQLTISISTTRKKCTVDGVHRHMTLAMALIPPFPFFYTFSDICMARVHLRGPRTAHNAVPRQIHSYQSNVTNERNNCVLLYIITAAHGGGVLVPASHSRCFVGLPFRSSYHSSLSFSQLAYHCSLVPLKASFYARVAHPFA
jgi:hypothetical protein